MYASVGFGRNGGRENHVTWTEIGSSEELSARAIQVPMELPNRTNSCDCQVS